MVYKHTKKAELRWEALEAVAKAISNYWKVLKSQGIDYREFSKEIDKILYNCT